MRLFATLFFAFGVSSVLMGLGIARLFYPLPPEMLGDEDAIHVICSSLKDLHYELRYRNQPFDQSLQHEQLWNSSVVMPCLGHEEVLLHRLLTTTQNVVYFLVPISDDVLDRVLARNRRWRVHSERGLLVFRPAFPWANNDIELFRHLDRLQFPDSCGLGRGVVLQGLMSHGLASVLHFVPLVTVHTMAMNRTHIILPGDFRYQNTSKCSFGNPLSCFFLPYSSCGAMDLPKGSDYQLLLNISHPHKLKPQVLEVHPRLTRDIGTSFPRKIPRELSQMFPTYTYFDIRSLLVLFLASPNKVLRQHVSAAKKSLKLPAHFVALHVRRGDKRVEAKLFSLRDYLAKIVETKQSRNVFLMTDDPAVVTETANCTDFRFFILQAERVAARSFQDYFRNTDPLDAGFMLLTEILIAAEAEWFFGTFSSNIGKFVAELIWASRRKATWTSLDSSSPLAKFP